MKTVLITGFEPFGGEQINPSWESVQRLPDELGGVRIVKLQIPTLFGKAAKQVVEKAESLFPDYVLCIGQAGGRPCITPEVVGINLLEANLPDNAGHQPVNTPISFGGAAAYFSTLPVRELVAALKADGIPAALSFSAGTFVCNEVLYTLLQRFENTPVKVGFVHVPFLPEQAKDKFPSLPLETITKGLRIIIQTLSVLEL